MRPLYCSHVEKSFQEQSDLLPSYVLGIGSQAEPVVTSRPTGLCIHATLLFLIEYDRLGISLALRNQ